MYRRWRWEGREGNHLGRSPMCGMRKEGEVKVGSSLDNQIWYEPYQASEFRLFKKTDLLRSFLMNECKLCNVFWFLVLTNPVLVTSKQLRVHLYPEMSVRKCEYLFVFSLCLLSMFVIIGTVSSVSVEKSRYSISR